MFSSSRRTGLLAAVVAVIGVLVSASPAAAQADKVLVLGSSVVGANSPEVQRITALGFEAEVVSNADWASKTASDFAAYRAIVLGDASCGGSVAAAEANADIWGPVIDGNVILIGTDPVYHDGQGGRQLTDSGIA